MNRRRALVHLTSLCLLGTSAVSAAVAEEAPQTEPTLWHRDLIKARQAAIESQRPMLIVFGAKWCTFCRKLEQDTLTEEETSQLIGREFVPVYLDFDREKRVAEVLEVTAIPCTVIISSDAEFLGRHRGYASPAKFRKTLGSAIEAHQEIQQARFLAK